MTFVCENHPWRPFDGPNACGCGGAGMPSEDAEAVGAQSYEWVTFGSTYTVSSTPIYDDLVTTTSVTHSVAETAEQRNERIWQAVEEFSRR